MAGGMRNEMREALQGNNVAVLDCGLYGFCERGNTRHERVPFRPVFTAGHRQGQMSDSHKLGLQRIAVMLGKQPIFTIFAELEGITGLGRTPYGERRVIGILGGSVRGPKLNGRILPGGADWQLRAQVQFLFPK